MAQVVTQHEGLSPVQFQAVATPPALTGTAPPAKRRRRGALGCYTCRFRKVRCTDAAPSSHSSVSSCSNCTRLHFDCRWRSPEPGEGFVPPPKRRRTFTSDIDMPATSNPAAAAPGHPAPASAATADGRLDQTTSSSDGPRPTYDDPRTQLMEPDSAPPPPGLDILAEFDDFLGVAGDLGWTPGLDFITPIPSYDFTAIDPFSAPPLPTPPPPLQQPPAQAVGPSMARVGPSAPSVQIAMDTPSIDDENRHLIQHYLETMKSFAKVEDRTPDNTNLYISAFTRALYLPALFHAILAYSASHLGLADAAYLPRAEEYTLSATEALQAPLSSEADVEGLLSAVYILIKREHMACTPASVPRVLSLLAVAGDIITSPHGSAALRDATGFARRISLRLAYVDCRAALFRLGGGGFVPRLRALPTLKDLFEGEWSGGVALLRSNLFRLRVAEFDARLYQSLHEDVVSSRGVRREEVLQLKEEIEKELRGVDVHDDEEAGPVDAQRYNRWVVAASCHSCLLYLNHISPLPNFDPQASAHRILTLQLAARADPLRKDTPSSVWPFSLFMAGISTGDAVHRAWICDHLERSERWGMNVRLVRELLVAVVGRMRAAAKEAEQGMGQGGRGYVDIRDVMSETTGEFMF